VRARARSPRPRTARHPVRRHDGRTFLFSTREAGLGRTIFVSGPALLRHGFGRALCCEPEADNVPLLGANVALNRVANRVEVVEAAVSDLAGRASFGRGPETQHGRRTGIGSLHRSVAGTATVDVEVVTLGESLATRGISPREVGLLWIDAQGADGHVLRGGRALTDAGVPVVFALRSKQLREAGGVDPLLERLAGYSWSVDLRLPGAVPVPTEGLAERVQRTPNTDLLVF
jgi:FkbM family methyltransferase